MKFISLTLLLSLLLMTPATAQDTELKDDIEQLKKDVLKLNRNLFILEEDLLFPANTQLNVFVSVDSGQLFELDSIQLKIDDKVVSNHLYTQIERSALKRGGVQKLYLGNLQSGAHELIALFIGKGPNDRDYRRGLTVEFEKQDDPIFIQLMILDDSASEQPLFESKVWE